MTGTSDRENAPGPEPGRDPDIEPTVARHGLSSGLFHSLTLILIGASIGVFWREVFQLTIRAIEAFR